MKKLLIALAVVALVGAGSAASAHMWGGGPGYGYGGQHMWGGGPGYGCGGPGYGGHHMRGGGPGWWGYQQDEETQKFLDETVELRKELHAKKFDLREAYRTGDEEKIEALRKDVTELRDKLQEKGAPIGKKFGRKGWGYGPGTCPGPYGG